MRKYITMIIAAFAMVISGLVAAPAANAEGSNPVKVTVTASSVDEASIKDTFTLKNETRAVIDGATQVSWEVSNHNVKVTKKQLRKAVRIKVKATGANSSKVIYKKAVKKLTKKISKRKAKKAARIVVLKKGSCVRNTGKENKLRVGFIWCLEYKAVLVLDKKSGQYRHAYNIRGGKLIKTCLNYIGGNVPMRDKVVQVRYEEDVLMNAEGEVVSKAAVNLTLAVTCPTSTFTVNTTADGRGSASGSLSYTGRTKVNAINAKKVTLSQEARGEIKLDAESSALATITVEYDCGNPPPSTHDECPDIPGDQPEGYECEPPPPSNPPVFVQFREFNDLEVNWVDDHCVTVDTPAGHTATVYWEADFGSFAIPQKTAQDGVQICSDYKAPSEVPAGGTDQITVRAVDNVTDLSVTDSTDPFVIHPTAPHPE